MSLIAATNLSLKFGKKIILDKNNIRVEYGERIGLIGPNGSGKSTLLALLCKKIEPDTGEINRSKDLRIGHLPQELTFTPEQRLMQFIFASVPGKLEMENRINKLRSELELCDSEAIHFELLHQIEKETSDFEHFETMFSLHEAEMICYGLGFSKDDLHRPISELAGGWKMRAALAGLLFAKPDLLLLDEPTNHLDVPSVQWTDEFLLGVKSAVVLVCHDKEFLNRHSKRILSFEPEGLRSYHGNYDDYLRQREEELEVLEAKSKNIDAIKKSSERFINRFRSDKRRARQVRSRIKMLEKLENIEVPNMTPVVEFSFPTSERSGKRVVELININKSFDDKLLYRNLSLTVERGDRLALIGVNGAGKTTLLKIIAGIVEPDSGKVKIGHNVTFIYFAQHLSETLDQKKTILEEAWQMAPTASQSYVRGVLGAFLFTGDEVEKCIGVLSGGEKSRVALAKMLLAPGNLLLLDEPTNHLDIFSSEALIQALGTFGGTMIFVSHNKSLINRLATKIWYLKDGYIEEFPGNLDDFLYHQKNLDESLNNERVQTRKIRSAKEEEKQRKRLEAIRRQEIYRKLNPLLKKINEVEERTSFLEIEQKRIGELLSNPDVFSDSDKCAPLFSEFEKNKHEIEELISRWEILQQQYLNTKKLLGVE